MTDYTFNRSAEWLARIVDADSELRPVFLEGRNDRWGYLLWMPSPPLERKMQVIQGVISEHAYGEEVNHSGSSWAFICRKAQLLLLQWDRERVG